MEYTYSEVKTEKGIVKYRHWKERFEDEDTDNFVLVDRKEPIELNGEPLVWYSSSQINQMSEKEKAELLI